MIRERGERKKRKQTLRIDDEDKVGVSRRKFSGGERKISSHWRRKILSYYEVEPNYRHCYCLFFCRLLLLFKKFHRLDLCAVVWRLTIGVNIYLFPLRFSNAVRLITGNLAYLLILAVSYPLIQRKGTFAFCNVNQMCCVQLILLRTS